MIARAARAVQPRDPHPVWRNRFLQLSPMFEALRPAGARIEAQERWPAVADYAALIHARVPLRTDTQRLLRFLPPARLESVQNYEQRVFDDGIVETREQNWHDLFNALVWASFPAAKAALNAAHVHALAARAPGANRSRAQDVLTLFDENGVIVASPDASAIALLQNHQWKELFWNRRAQTQARMRFFLFGHGLCEKVFTPYLGLTGKALVFALDAAFLAAPLTHQLEQLDQLLANWIAEPAHLISTRALTPLPVLGVPGWWPANACESFYENESYFRPKSARLLAVKR